MTIFFEYENLKLNEIWDDSNEFISDLGTLAPPFFANEYLLDPNKKAVIEWSYNLIYNHFEDNQIDLPEKQFKNAFVNTFISIMPAFFNSFNGDFSGIANINNIGDTTFFGEQTTEKSDDPFATPSSAGKYTFKQKTGQDLLDELNTRMIQNGEFIQHFTKLFQRLT